MLSDLVLLGSIQTFMNPLSLTGMTGTSANVNQIANDFFKNLFLHPDKNLIALGFFAILLIGAVLGITFLVKKVYDSHQKPAPPPPPSDQPLVLRE